LLIEAAIGVQAGCNCIFEKVQARKKKNKTVARKKKTQYTMHSLHDFFVFLLREMKQNC
jgi:hypothetical protein